MHLLYKNIIYEIIKILSLPSYRHDNFIKADIKQIYKKVMFFSDLKHILNNAIIVGKPPKKKIKYISDHSKNIDGNTLLVINQNKNFKLSYLKEAISKNLSTILTNVY